VLWGRYQGMTDVVAAHREGAHPVLADLALPGSASAITARSPLRWNGEHGDAGAAPALGRDTGAVLAEVLGLSDAEIGRLVAAGVVG
jgi:2-methylfumaryl-CoA isomerase